MISDDDKGKEIAWAMSDAVQEQCKCNRDDYDDCGDDDECEDNDDDDATLARVLVIMMAMAVLMMMMQIWMRMIFTMLVVLWM